MGLAIAGEVNLAATVSRQLKSAGIRGQPIGENALYGAHGVWDARRAFKGLPVVALSVLHNGADPEKSFVLGRALAPLRKQDVLILGSGFPTFHNFGRFSKPDRLRHGRVFGSWLTRTFATKDNAKRLQALSSWRSAPSGAMCHPEGDTHFTPTLVLAAAGQAPGKSVHQGSFSHILPNNSRDGAELHHWEFAGALLLNDGGKVKKRDDEEGEEVSAMAATSPQHWRQKLVQLFTKHNPKMLRKVDALLKEHKGNELALLQSVRAKYGEDVLSDP